jgi:hypothetical protein
MYSKGISWIDDCRIPFVDDKEQTFISNRSGIGGHQDNIVGGKPLEYYKYNSSTQGRFPANLLVSDDMLNDGVITKQSQRTYKPTDKTASLFGNSPQAHGIGIGDKGTNSRYYDIDKWFDNLIDV